MHLTETDLLTTIEAAACLSVSPKTLAYWRSTGDGPVFARLGVRSIRYRRGDLLAYVAERRRHNDVAPRMHADRSPA